MRKVVLLLLVLGIGVAGILITNGSIKGQVQENKLPTVDLNDKRPKDAKREKRNLKYNIKNSNINKKDFEFNEKSRDGMVTSSPDAPSEEAFPFGKSDEVVVGKITSAEAHLSEDKTSVYSEFQMTVNRSIKGVLVPGASIDVQRIGGNVRLPSGRIVSRPGFLGKNLPEANNTYVLFLDANENDDSFYIKTGYEIKAGRIIPLDKNPPGRKKVKQFENYEKYNNVPEQVFWSALEEAGRTKE